jgi:hypothetical protein
VQWTRRSGPDTLVPRQASAPAAVEPADRVMPGLAALFERVVPDRSHAILDLGSGDGSSLQVYSAYARWVRFADVLRDATSPEAWAGAVGRLRENADRPYDIIFLWDALDRLQPAERVSLMRRLSELCASDARLHAVVESPDNPSMDLMTFSLTASDRLRIVPSGVPRLAHPPIKPADVKGTLEPFHLLKAFSTRAGLREYVAVRRWAGADVG